jgi:hypothetical protein
MTNADSDILKKHYLPNYCRGCPARCNAPPQAGKLIHADIYIITSSVPSGNITAIAFVDEASGHKSVGILDDKSKGSLMDAIHPVYLAYKSAGKRIIEFRTDGEPTTQSITEPQDKLYDVRYSMSE